MASIFDTVMQTSGLPAIFGQFGESASVTRLSVEQATPTVIINRDYQRGPALIDQLGNLHGEKRTSIDFWLAQIAAESYTPSRGDVVTVGAESWTLDEKDIDDGLVSRWIVY